MAWRPQWWNGSVLATGALWVALLGSTGLAQERTGKTLPMVQPRTRMPAVPLETVAAGARESVKKVIEQPTLSSRGPMEVFRGDPEFYDWLLDHPDRAVTMWRRLGAQCVSIDDLGKGRFGWSDGKGSVVHWETVCAQDDMRIWYAEGKFKPDPLLPTVPVRAVVVLRYQHGRDSRDRLLIRHQADLYAQTDSKLAKMVARLLGPSAPHMAEQGLEQLEMFYSALVWYLEQYPEQAEKLLGPSTKTASSLAQESLDR